MSPPRYRLEDGPPVGGDLVRVIAPRFVAGLILRDDVCIYAAPILRWTIGMHRDLIRGCFEQRGWRASIIRRSCA